MKFLKRQGFGFWVSLLTLIVAVVAYGMYNQVIVAGDGLVMASGSEPFYDSTLEIYTTMTGIVGMSVLLALVLLVVSVVVGQAQPDGVLGVVFDFVVGVIRVVIPVLLMVALLNFLYGSLTGLGWTFFSNEELAIYPEAVAVGKNVILALGLFAGALVLSLFGSFFKISKKVEEKVEVEVEE